MLASFVAVEHPTVAEVQVGEQSATGKADFLVAEPALHAADDRTGWVQLERRGACYAVEEQQDKAVVGCLST